MNVGVYGLGRFGYFWAELLSQRFPVRAYNRNPERPTPPGVDRVSLEDLMKADAVFLCAAISVTETVLREIAPHAKPGTLVADTCSVKVYPCRLMESLLPAGVRLLATHPMFGPDSARNGVDKLPIVLHPLRESVEAYSFWEKTFSSMGMSVIPLSPEEHDKAAAYSQGVTHLIGRVLSEMGVAPHPIATQGFRSLLEIVQQTCNDPFQLFLDLQNYNPYTSAMREELRRAFDKIQALLSG